MFDTDVTVSATEEQRCAIILEAEARLAALGVTDTWNCLIAGALMAAKFGTCDEHYREILQNVCDHVTAELVSGQDN
jgi:hypothetical protein